MKQRILALLLVTALALGLCGMSVFAADPAGTEQSSAEQQEGGPLPDPASSDAGGEQPEERGGSGEVDGESEELDAAQAELVPDAVGTLSFSNLSGRMRENNFNLLALEESIASIEAIDYEKMTDDIRKQINQIANIQWSMITMPGGMGSIAAASMDSAYDALRDTFDDLKDGVIQEDNAAVIRQLRNAQDQIVMAAESIYVALTEMELTDRTLDRTLDALDRTIQEMGLRYDLGQISALTLQQTKAGRTSAVSGQQTLEMNIANYKSQLELMIGAELTGGIRLQPLPGVTAQELAAMDLEADLEAAKGISYSLFAAKRTLDDAQESFKDAGKDYNYNTSKYQYVSAQHTWQSAQYTYSAAVQSFENSFRTLYNQVKDYQQILAAAKTALACEKDSYAAAQLKFEQGGLSQNKLQEATDKVSDAQDKVDGAAIDLFSAYNNYRWAVDHGILN